MQKHLNSKKLFQKIVFRREYVSVSGILRIISIYMVIYSLGLVASQYVVSARMEKTYFLSVGLGSAISIMLCFLLNPIVVRSQRGPRAFERTWGIDVSLWCRSG